MIIPGVKTTPACLRLQVLWHLKLSVISTADDFTCSQTSITLFFFSFKDFTRNQKIIVHLFTFHSVAIKKFSQDAKQILRKLSKFGERGSIFWSIKNKLGCVEWQYRRVAAWTQYKLAPESKAGLVKTFREHFMWQVHAAFCSCFLLTIKVMPFSSIISKKICLFCVVVPKKPRRGGCTYYTAMYGARNSW